MKCPNYGSFSGKKQIEKFVQKKSLRKNSDWKTITLKSKKAGSVPKRGKNGKSRTKYGARVIVFETIGPQMREGFKLCFQQKDSIHS